VSKWYRTIFSNAKTHVFPATLRARLTRSFLQRGFKVAIGPECTRQAGVDIGRARLADEEIVSFEVAGLDLGFYLSDVPVYAEHMATVEPRDEIGRGYFKLHGALHCVCFTPWQFRALRRKVDEALPRLAPLARVENQRINRVFDQIAKSPLILGEDERLPEGIECEA